MIGLIRETVSLLGLDMRAERRRVRDRQVPKASVRSQLAAPVASNGEGRHQRHNALMNQEEMSSPIPRIYSAFGDFRQPSRYIVDDLYEPERIEYEEMLGGKPREAIEAGDFGLVSWGPLGFLVPEAAAYLLPRLMELAEVGSRDRSGDLFLMRFINYISLGPSSEEFSLLGSQQRLAVAEYLDHVALHHMAVVQEECWDDVLKKAIQLWSCG